MLVVTGTWHSEMRHCDHFHDFGIYLFFKLVKEFNAIVLHSSGAAVYHHLSISNKVTLLGI